MNIFRLTSNDQIWNNWLTRDEPDEGPVVLKPRFSRLACSRCLDADYDEIFRKGPDPRTRIRARGDFVQTADGYLCMNRRLRDLLVRHHVFGIRFKQIGITDWFLACITGKVEHDRSVYKIGKDLDGYKYCPKCKRPTGLFGIHDFERQIQKPRHKLAFFTTRLPREVFVTEGVVQLLKKAKIKGGMVTRMLNGDEEITYKASVKAGKERWPSHSRMNL